MCKNAKITVLRGGNGDKCESRLPSTFLHFCFISLLPHSYYGFFINKDIVKEVDYWRSKGKKSFGIFIWKSKQIRPPLNIKIQLQFIKLILVWTHTIINSKEENIVGERDFWGIHL